MSGKQTHRLDSGGRIDRAKTLRFRLNGRELEGYAGDTLASALFANGVRLLGRSFKYHRPRGLLSAGFEEPNAMLEVTSGGTTRPVTRATLQPLSEGLRASSINCWPGVKFDTGRLLDFSHWLWPAGFYNKTFKWPNWEVYEGFIRRSAGLGKLPGSTDHTSYHQQNTHCDVFICGAGPSGLVAALNAARSGARVLLAEQDREIGGSLLFESYDLDGMSATGWLDKISSELDSLDNLQIMTSATVAGYYDHNVLTIHEREYGSGGAVSAECYWKVRAGQVILATGAIEQPLVFTNNDRPGIMLAGAVRHYLNRYAVTPGHRSVIATNNDSAYRTAFALHDAGIDVAAIVDLRQNVSGWLQQQVDDRSIWLFKNSVISDTQGGNQLRSVVIGNLAGTDAMVKIDCDLLAVSGGWNPTAHLFSQAGGRLRYDEDLACFVPGECAQSLAVVGKANGRTTLSQSLDEAAARGAEAAAAAGFASTGKPTAPAVIESPESTAAPKRISPVGKKYRQWVDFHHDVTVADIELAVRENFVSVEHLKRYTTTGMAVDQGKTSNLNALTLLAELTGRTVGETGTTTFRPQFMPVTLGAIAGRATGGFYRPLRYLPAHDWHKNHGAVFNDYGGWQRPDCYPREGESHHDAIQRESLAVRNSVGLFDGSPLGKIEVRGPDAAEFLNRVYINNALTLKPGRVRYGLMLNENGIIIDDGVFICLAENHYLVNTTSGGADRIAAWMEEWHQCEWPHMQLVITPVTTQWSVSAVVGPRAREVLQKLDCDIDFAAESFPHMSIRTGTLEGVTTRIQRVSYSGEAGFEISVPADRGEALWEALMDAGREFAITPYGIEAVMLLRTEKGYLHVGADTDGTSTPLEVGMGFIIDKKKTDFIGRRSLSRPANLGGNRRQLVGLEFLDEEAPVRPGGHLAEASGDAWRSQGFVTSAFFSPVLQRPVALGLLERGFDRNGEMVTVFDDGNTYAARVVSPVFYDPENERLNG